MMERKDLQDPLAQLDRRENQDSLVLMGYQERMALMV